MDTQNFIAGHLTLPELVELIEYHNRRYWELGEPEIPDTRYDELMRALAKLAPDHELLTRVYAPAVAGSGKVRHTVPMLSLDKAYSLEEVMKWANKYARTPDELLLVEPKYDGISAGYDGRILSTRGDGEYGENITAKLPLVELETTGYKGPIDRPVRGELVIRDDDFRTLYSHIRKKGGGTYKNSRNAVAGIMGLKEIAEMLAQGAKITLVDYNMVSFRVKLSELEAKWPELLAELEALPYPQDGVVLKLADRDYEASLGNTAHHPRGQIAFKFSGVRRESRVRAVEWSFGKNCLTPVAEIDPVEYILEKTHGLGVDVVLEMSGAPAAIANAFKVVRKGGRFSAFGIPPHDVSIDYANGIIFKGVHLNGINGRKMFQTWFEVRNFLSSKRLDISPVVTHILPLENYKDGFDILTSPEAKCGKIVLKN